MESAHPTDVAPTAPWTVEAAPSELAPEPDIGWGGKLVVILFLIGMVGFGAITLGNLIFGLLR